MDSPLPTSIKQLKKQTLDALQTVLFPILPDELKKDFEKVVQPSKGTGFDIDIVCFSFAKVMKKKPEQVAEMVLNRIKEANMPLFRKTGTTQAWVHLAFSTHVLACAALGQCVVEKPEEKEDLGPLVLEFSSPNTNKPQHLGHVRNNVLGDCVARLLTYAGYRVTKVNLINDRGIHICKSMLAWQKFGKGDTPQSTGVKGDHLVGQYYVAYETAFMAEYKKWLVSEQGLAEFEKWKASGSGKAALDKGEKELKRLLSLRESQAEEKKKNGKKEEEIVPAKPLTSTGIVQTIVAILISIYILLSHFIFREQKRLATQPDPEQKKIDSLSPAGIFKDEYKDYYGNNFSEIGKEAGQMLVKWEAGDEEVRKLWATMNGWVFDGFAQTYKRYGIAFDEVEKESDIYEYGKEIVLKGLKDGVMEKLENGAIAIDLADIGVLKKGAAENERKKVLLRANGTSVYMTQDIGTAARRLEKYNAKKLIYVVADEQNRHFQILFKLMEKLYPESKDSWFHLGYGLVLLPSGRMKSREGTVVDADDLISELVQMAKKVTKEKWPEISEQEIDLRSEKVGMAALKYYILSFGPATTITFDPEESLQFKGKAGPYMLYQYARTRSILRKGNVKVEDLKFDTACLSKLSTDEEHAVLTALYQIPRELDFAAKKLDPSKICDLVYNISQEFNRFYKLKDKHQVVNCTDPELRHARLLIVLAVGNVLKMCLNMLGIEVLEQM